MFTIKYNYPNFRSSSKLLQMLTSLVKYVFSLWLTQGQTYDEDSTDLIVPLELWLHGQPHSENSASDWLNTGLQVQTGNLIDTLLYNSSHPRMVDHVT